MTYCIITYSSARRESMIMRINVAETKSHTMDLASCYIYNKKTPTRVKNFNHLFSNLKFPHLPFLLGHYPRQARSPEYVRVSRLQDTYPWSNLCMDF